MISQYKSIAEFLNKCSYIVITAGAGMNMDSGLQNLKGTKDLWSQYQPFKDKVELQKIATPQFQKQNPALFWGFYGHRLQLYRDTQPHQGYNLLKKFTEMKNVEDHFVLTNNVDGHFQKTGISNDRLLEVNGSMSHFQCDDCYEIFSSEAVEIKYDQSKFEAEMPLPTCQHCGSTNVRPNKLLFDDNSFQKDRVNQQEEEFEEFQKRSRNIDNKEKKMIIFELGVDQGFQSTKFYGEQMFNLSKQDEVMFVRINSEGCKTPLVRNDIDKKRYEFVPIQERAETALQHINEELQALN